MQEQSERSERDLPNLDWPEVGDRVERVRGQPEELDTQIRRVVQDRPLLTAGVALAFGYALGRLLARR